MEASSPAATDAPAASPPGATAPAAPPSTRERLARVALDGATALGEVVRGEVGGHGVWQTSHPDGPVAGVVAVARPDGRFDLELHLVARPVPLHPLAEQVRERVRKVAEKAGLGDRLGPVEVDFEDVEEEGSPEARSAEDGSPEAGLPEPADRTGGPAGPVPPDDGPAPPVAPEAVPPGPPAAPEGPGPKTAEAPAPPAPPLTPPEAPPGAEDRP